MGRGNVAGRPSREPPAVTTCCPVDQVTRVAFCLDEAVDAKDWVLVRKQFARLVEVRIGVVAGEDAVMLPADVLVAGIAALNPAAKQSFHALFNPIVTVTENRAHLRAKRYGWAFCKDMVAPLHELWGRVSYQFTLSGGEWLIDHIQLETLREAGNQDVALLRG